MGKKTRTKLLLARYVFFPLAFALSGNGNINRLAKAKALKRISNLAGDSHDDNGDDSMRLLDPNDDTSVLDDTAIDIEWEKRLSDSTRNMLSKILELVDTVFQLRRRGWWRRRALWGAAQVRSVQEGEHVDAKTHIQKYESILSSFFFFFWLVLFRRPKF